MFSIISNLSSIVTLILFIFYIIGRIWSIINSKHYIYEQIDLVFEDEFDFNSCENFVVLNEKGNDIISISGENGIREIKIYKVKYDDVNNTFIKEKLEFKYLSLYPNEKLFLKSTIPEGIPSHIIEIDRVDYVKIVNVLSVSGINGKTNIFGSDVKITLRSILFYLFK